MDIIKSFEDGICRITLQGKFTFFDHAAFREIMDEIGHDNVRQIILDMADLTFIDSAGLGMLLLLHDEVGKFEKPLIISGAAGQVKKMFEVAHFEALFTMQDKGAD